MALDGITIYALASELSGILDNCKIEKVNQPTKDELVLTVRKRAFNHKLLINVGSSNSRVHFLTENRENPKTPPMFCMLLRKHLAGSVIKNVKTFDFERLLEFELDTYDELGYATKKYLIIELLGKFSNLILLNSERVIIDCLKRVDFESSVRPLLPNIYYDYPPKQQKISIFDLPDDFSAESSSDLQEKVLGLSPLSAEILFDENPETLRDNLKKIIVSTQNQEFNCYLLYKDNRPFDFSILPHPKYKSEKHDNFSFMLCDFFEKKDQTNALKSVHKELSKTVKTLINRKIRKLKIQAEELNDTKTRDTFKIYGDLIVANLYAISDEKREKISLIDYYSEDLSEITIPLDITLSPRQNADRYFAKYNKLKTAEEILTKEMEKGEIDLSYLESVLETIERTTSTNELLEIKNELANAGFIKPTKSNKKPPVSKPNKYLSSDGFTILSGKNNVQNDILTLKTAYKSDIWFHTQKIHGTHVILFTEGKEVPENTMRECAIIAACNSKAKNSSNVPVDYCPVSNVRKPRGGKAGMVIYDNYNTIYVNPDEELLKKLMVN